MLNNWLGVLLRAFNTLPSDAQQAVLTFLGVSVKVFASANTHVPYPEDGSDTTEYNNATLFAM